MVDGKTTGAGFGREVVKRGQGTVLLINTKQGQQAAGPLAGKEETAVRGQVQICPPTLSLITLG
ncbi:hypothetical protein D3C73_1461200 [compost metagenome]